MEVAGDGNKVDIGVEIGEILNQSDSATIPIFARTVRYVDVVVIKR